MAYREGDEPVPGYRLEAFLGRGGFGEVWKADGPGGTPAAIKFISLSGKQGLKEFRALGLVKRIRHPNLVPITAFWLKDRDGRVLETEIGDSLTQLPSKAAPGQPAELIIAMGLGDRNLLDRLEQCREEGLPGVPPEELLDYLEDAARAIDYMNSPVHDLGHGAVAVQHCDIKPQNIMIVGGAAQVCDFGLARALDDVRVTTAAGSPAYGAPECLEGNKPSASTDQYSLAISYVELRTGELPFADQSLMGVINAHLQGQLDLSRLTPPEREVILKATARNPDARFPNTQKMVRALRRAVEGSSPGTLLAEQAVTVAQRRAGEVSLAVGAELVPGYRLSKHVVRGGTNDVWEASAPGGKSVAMLVRRLDPQRETVDLGALGAVQTLEEHPNLTDVQAYWLLSETGDTIPPDASDALNKSRWLVIAGKLAKGTLLDRLEECRRKSGWGIPTAELLSYVQQLAQAVDFLNAPRHAYAGRTVGISHGNLRPVNFLLFGDVVRLGNFGRAMLLEGDLTKLSHAVGFEHPYTAPEILLGRVSRWSDQYGLAIAYTQLRTGRLPFPATASTSELVDMQKKGQLDLSALTPGEEKVIARATHLEPKKRFPTCEEFVASLRSAAGIAAPSPAAEKKSSPLPAEPAGGVAVATAADTSIDPLRATMPTSAGETPIDSGLLPELVRSARDSAATATMLLGGETVGEPPSEDPAAAARGTLMAPGGVASSAAGSRVADRAPGWQKRPAERSRRALYWGGGIAAGVVAAGALALALTPGRNPEASHGTRTADAPPVVTPTPDGVEPPPAVPPKGAEEAKLLVEVATARSEIDADPRSKLRELEQARAAATQLGDARLEALATLGCRQALARLNRWSELPQLAAAALNEPQDRAINAALDVLAQSQNSAAGARGERLAALLAVWPQRDTLPAWERDELAKVEADMLAEGRQSLAEGGGPPDAELAWADQLLQLAPGDARLLAGKAVQQVRAERLPDALATFGQAAQAAGDDAERRNIEEQRAGVEAIEALRSAPHQAPERIAQVAAMLPRLKSPIASQLLADVLKASPNDAPTLRPAAIKLLKAGDEARLLAPHERQSLGELLSAELAARVAAAASPEQVASLGEITGDLAQLNRDDPLARLVDIERRLDGPQAHSLSAAQLKTDASELRALAQKPGPLAAYADYLSARLAALDPSGAETAADALVAAASQKDLPDWLLTPWRRTWSYDHLMAAAMKRFHLPEGGWLPGIAGSPFQGDGATRALSYFDAAGRWAPVDAKPTTSQLLCEAFASAGASQPNLERAAQAAQRLLEGGELSPALRTSLAVLETRALAGLGRPAAEVLKRVDEIAGAIRSNRDLQPEDAVATYDHFIQPTLAWAETQSADGGAKRALARLNALYGAILYDFGEADWTGRIENPRVEELRAFDRAAQLDPDNVEYRAYRGYSNLRQASPKLDEAQADAEAAIAANPESPAAHGLKSQVLIERSRVSPDLAEKYKLVETALAPANEAVRLARQAREAGAPGAERLETYLINGSVAHLDAVNFSPTMTEEQKSAALEEAARMGLEAAALNQTFRFAALVAAGNALEDLAWISHKQANYDRSVEAFTEAIQHRPDNFKGYFNRGRCQYKRVGDSNQDRQFLELAMADLAEAVRLSPEHAQSYYWLGMSKGRRDGWLAGIADLKTAVEKETPGSREQLLYAVDLAHATYEAAKRAARAAAVAPAAAKPQEEAKAKQYAADCLKTAEMLRSDPQYAATGLGYQALLLLNEGKLQDAIKLLEKPMAESAAGIRPTDPTLLAALVRCRRAALKRSEEQLRKAWNFELSEAEADAARRGAMSNRESMLAWYEIGLLAYELTVESERQLNRDPALRAQADKKKEAGARAMTAVSLRNALALDSKSADATDARSNLLRILYQQVTLDKDNFDPQTLQKMRQEGLALIDQVQRDPLSDNAQRDKAKGVRTEFSKK